MLSPAHSFRLQPQDLPVLSVENETPVLRNFVFELGCFVFEFRQCFGIRFLWVSFLLLPGSTPDMNSRRGWEKIDKQDFLIIVKIKTLGELCILMCGRFPWEGLCVYRWEHIFPLSLINWSIFKESRQLRLFWLAFHHQLETRNLF